MRRLSILLFSLLTLVSCTEYAKVQKNRDPEVKFAYAKKAFEQKRYVQASTLLNDVITPLRGTADGEESLYLLAMSHFENKDYLDSGVFFKTYYTRYPKGKYAELARYYSGYGYYLDSPDPQLDQSNTVKAIQELQTFLDYYPKSEKALSARNAIFEMQDKLTLKELQNVQLYYNLGNFMGNNYEAAIITAQNALKEYPYSKYREDFEFLILKSKFQIAKESVAEKKEDRFREVIDEYFSFTNNFPDTDKQNEAQNIYNIARRHVRE